VPLVFISGPSGSKLPRVLARRLAHQYLFHDATIERIGHAIA
jgi:hypothetical protein